MKSSAKPIQMLLVAFVAILMSGCGSLRYWWNNNHMVGPNYCRPNAAVAENWNDIDSVRIDTSCEIDSCWWHVFNDPDLNLLIEQIKSQNLSLKAACQRIREARHLRQIAAANLLPQSQSASAGFAHTQNSANSEAFVPGFAPLTLDDWSIDFDAAWELDLWGRIRRSVDAADAQVCERVHDYNFALISLIADTASLYIQVRSIDERIELARRNVMIQEGSLDIAQKRFNEGRTNKLDVAQAKSNLASTRSLIPQLELARRQALNALCVLIGQPPSEVPFLSQPPGRIPDIPPQIMVGVPASLLCRRPDIRAAERRMFAQFQQIGIAEADLYPTLAISGNLGYNAASLSDLFDSDSFGGTIAPGFRWNILNFGRLKQAICFEDARFKQIMFDYQNSVLDAQREVEDGIVEFIKKSEQYQFDMQTAEANEESVDLAIASFKAGKSDFSRVFVVQSNLVLAQDQVVNTRACIAQALIRTYRALGGGWGCSCDSSASCNCAPTQSIDNIEIVSDSRLEFEASATGSD
jgi:NodT family efflux transporter outer membrane factor (OMF) lipoprotein